MQFINKHFSIMERTVWVLVWSIAIGIRGAADWHQIPFLSYWFRQSQTALTAYWFVRDGFNLLFPPLPLFGSQGTSIPFEFPFFQSIVAACCLAFNAHTPDSIVFAGQLLNCCFFFCAGIVLYWSLRKHYANGVAATALILWLLLPFCVFWSMSNLIEFSAVTFTLIYFHYVLEWIDCKKLAPHQMLVCALCGVAAYLIKITTVLIFVPSIAIYYLAINARFKTINSSKISTVQLPTLSWFTTAGFLLLMPLICGLTWVKWADHVKSQNVVGKLLTSTNLQNWNFGTVAQRFDAQTWQYIWYITADQILGPLGIVLCLIGFLKCLTNWRSFCWMLPAPVAYLMFTNLYFVHYYYHTATLPSLIFLAAIGLDCLIWRTRVRGALYIMVSLGVAVTMWLLIYESNYPMASLVRKGPSFYLFAPFFRSHIYDYSDVASAIKKYSGREDWICISGFDWDSDIALYSERRAIMVPDFATTETRKKLFATPAALYVQWEPGRAKQILDTSKDDVLMDTPLYKITRR